MSQRLARLGPQLPSDYWKHRHAVMDRLDKTLFRFVFPVRSRGCSPLIRKNSPVLSLTGPGVLQRSQSHQSQNSRDLRSSSATNVFPTYPGDDERMLFLKTAQPGDDVP